MINGDAQASAAGPVSADSGLMSGLCGALFPLLRGKPRRGEPLLGLGDGFGWAGAWTGSALMGTENPARIAYLPQTPRSNRLSA